MWRLAVRAVAGRAQSRHAAFSARHLLRASLSALFVPRRASLRVLRAETPFAWSAPQLPLAPRDAFAVVREYAKGGKGGGKGARSRSWRGVRR